jgi:hypothetical protein
VHLKISKLSIIKIDRFFQIRQKYDKIDVTYIQPCLMRTPRCRGKKIADTVYDLNVIAAVNHLKKYGSFVALTASDSRANLSESQMIFEGDESVCIY